MRCWTERVSCRAKYAVVWSVPDTGRLRRGGGNVWHGRRSDRDRPRYIYAVRANDLHTGAEL
jgi:hypothetical protein